MQCFSLIQLKKCSLITLVVGMCIHALPNYEGTLHHAHAFYCIYTDARRHTHLELCFYAGQDDELSPLQLS